MWGKNCLNVGVFLVMVFVLFSCKKDPVDLGFEVKTKIYKSGVRAGSGRVVVGR